MVNPVMMHAKTVKRYIATVDKINEDLITRIRSIKDDKDEVPGDFGNEMNKWALESIAYIALDQRLGLLGDTDPNSDGQKLIQVKIEDEMKIFLKIIIYDVFIHFSVFTTSSICLTKLNLVQQSGNTTRHQDTTN